MKKDDHISRAAALEKIINDREKPESERMEAMIEHAKIWCPNDVERHKLRLTLMITLEKLDVPQKTIERILTDDVN